MSFVNKGMLFHLRTLLWNRLSREVVESPSWEVFKKRVMWHFRTWFSRHGGDGLMVGFDELRSLFQPY